MLLSALRGVVSLMVQGHDRLQIADPVAAKALALLALTRNLNSFKPDREECLLAETMSYFGSAEALAGTLIMLIAVPGYLYWKREKS